MCNPIKEVAFDHNMVFPHAGKGPTKILLAKGTVQENNKLLHAKVKVNMCEIIIHV